MSADPRPFDRTSCASLAGGGGYSRAEVPHLLEAHGRREQARLRALWRLLFVSLRRLRVLWWDWRDGRDNRYPICCIARYVLTGGTPRGGHALRRGIRFADAPEAHVPCGWFHDAD